MAGDLSARLDEWDRAHADVDSRGFTEDEEWLAGAGEALANSLRELLAKPLNMQALALARLMRDRAGQHVQIHDKPFDLPDGYWLVVFDHGSFECGIAPNGDVSS